MAGKKSKNDIDAIRGELNALAEAVYSLREHLTIENAATAASRANAKGEAAAIVPLTTADAQGGVVISGTLHAAATTDSGEATTFAWETGTVGLAAIVDQDFDALARMLAAIGHRQRIAILNAILAKPSSANELVTQLGLGTTGAAYHHLKVLQNAELVTLQERGRFAVPAEKIGVILTILASPLVTTRVAAAPADGKKAKSAD